MKMKIWRAEPYKCNFNKTATRNTVSLRMRIRRALTVIFTKLPQGLQFDAKQCDGGLIVNKPREKKNHYFLNLYHNLNLSFHNATC